MNDEKIKPCPFCGREATFCPAEDVYGTCFDYDCDCGLASLSLQICDYMTRDERIGDEFTDYQYGLKYIKRVRNEAIKRWNSRQPEITALQAENERLTRYLYQIEWFRNPDMSDKEVAMEMIRLAEEAKLKRGEQIEPRQKTI